MEYDIEDEDKSRKRKRLRKQPKRARRATHPVHPVYDHTGSIVTRVEGYDITPGDLAAALALYHHGYVPDSDGSAPQ
ncbi:hypothetical protein ACIBKY_51170 [Nonomuraea sp. NPDC050394]|uniref:hypothetical protein n=1 Tax=Nonomuraea sp. NPDC050394 TaxID=3364363 RepID=UPI003790CC68